jgi:hypothetical protein
MLSCYASQFVYLSSLWHTNEKSFGHCCHGSIEWYQNTINSFLLNGGKVNTPNEMLSNQLDSLSFEISVDLMGT